MPTLDSLDDLTVLGQDAKSVLSGDAPGVVDDTVEHMFTTEGDGDWGLRGTIGVEKVERFYVKRSLHVLQEGCCSKKLKVPETVSQPFGLAMDLLLCGESADSPDVSDA